MYKTRLLSKALGTTRVLGHRHSHGGGGGFDLGGVFVPIPTPYQKNGDIDYGALAANFQRWEKIPFRGDYLQGIFSQLLLFSYHVIIINIRRFADCSYYKGHITLLVVYPSVNLTTDYVNTTLWH